MSQVAVITGALKGIGYETAKALLSKGFRVVVAGRDARRGQVIENELKGRGDATFVELDVARPESIEKFVKTVLDKFGTVDVLINNAGIYPDKEEVKDLAGRAGLIHAGFATNAVGPYLLAERLMPMMLKKGHGRVVNVSSGMGQLSEMGKGSPAYRLSKVALNGVTKMLAATTTGTDVLVNSVCPGWVKTDMGGENAPLTPEQGASGIVWAAMLPVGGPNGGFFRNGKPLEF